MSDIPAITAFASSSGASIYRLPVEAFPKMWTNLYLIHTAEMLVLIDTGSGSDKCNEDLQHGISEVGYKLSDLTHILLTHGHIDHYGGLVSLHEKTKAQIGVHELDWQTVSNHEARLALMSGRLNIFMKHAGVPDEQREQFLQMYQFTKALYRSVPVDFTYESVGMQVGPLEMIHVPGHCPGHVAIKLDDILFCGDMVLEKITPHQSPEDLTSFLGVRHYLKSLSVLQAWSQDVRLVLNGHDDPIVDFPARIQDIRHRLSKRIRHTLEALSEPRTIAETTSRIYGEVGGYNALLVIEKIGAYVEYLYQSGLLEITNLDELENGNWLNPIRYRRSISGRNLEILPKERAYVFV
jgi:glyoxylase-like metal-dependent hydrolase (beta-lactamase superfamily II)